MNDGYSDAEDEEGVEKDGAKRKSEERKEGESERAVSLPCCTEVWKSGVMSHDR